MSKGPLNIILAISIIANVALGVAYFGASEEETNEKDAKQAEQAFADLPVRDVDVSVPVLDDGRSVTYSGHEWMIEEGVGRGDQLNQEGYYLGSDYESAQNQGLYGGVSVARYLEGSSDLAEGYGKKENETLRNWYDRVRDAFGTAHGDREPVETLVLNGREWLVLEGAAATESGEYVIVLFDAALGRTEDEERALELLASFRKAD